MPDAISISLTATIGKITSQQFTLDLEKHMARLQTYIEIKGGTKMYPEIDKERCVNCGLCLVECEMGVFDTDSEKKIVVAAPEDCVDYGNCLVVCPEDAISLY